MHHISDIATDPTLTWIPEYTNVVGNFTKKGKPARVTVEGKREGVPIRVEHAGKGIITAHPIY